MTHEEEFRAYMKAASNSTGTDESHLGEAFLIAYCRGEMSGAERESAEAHLVACEQCIALFRSARDFLEPAGADEEEVTAAETNDAWQALAQGVQTTSATELAGSNVRQGEFRRPRNRNFFTNSRVTLAMAASLLISFGALGLLGWRLWQERQSRQQSEQAAAELENRQRELEQRLSQIEQNGAHELKREREQRMAAEAERDRLQTLLASVQPGQQNIPVYPFRLSSERGAEEDLRLNVSGSVRALRLRLLRSKPYEFSSYAIELTDERGKVVREISQMRPAASDGTLNMLLKRASLSTGKYKLRLFGLEGKTKKLLGEYGLSVTITR
jgi:hypothetical protein